MPRMTEEERFAEIFEAIEALISKGETPSYRNIRQALGAKRGRDAFGDNATIGRAKKMWEDAQKAKEQPEEKPEEPPVEIPAPILAGMREWVITERSAVIKAKDAEIAELQEKLELMTDDRDELQATADNLKQRLVDAHAALEQMTSERDRAIGKAEEQAERIATLERRVDDLIKQTQTHNEKDKAQDNPTAAETKPKVKPRTTKPRGNKKKEAAAQAQNDPPSHLLPGLEETKEATEPEAMSS